MARRRKTRRTRTRRRVSGFGGSDLKVVAGVVIGAIGGSFANAQVAKMSKPIDPKIVAAVEVLGGGFLATKARSPLVKGIGYGLAATGAIGAGKSFGFISGFRDLSAINGMRRINGLADRIGNTGRQIMNGANQKPNITGRAFPAPRVVSGMGSVIPVLVNGHGDGSAM